MNNIKIFEFHGNAITFDMGDAVMINATEMAKPFGKLPADWLRQASTKKFLSTLSTVKGIHISKLVVIKKGGTQQGTWMHEYVALEFARWLSPEFGIWSNDRLKELLTIGITATPAMLEKLMNDPDLIIELAQELKYVRTRNHKLKSRVNKQREELSIARPKAEYYDQVMSTDDVVSTTIIAKNLGMSAITLNRILHHKGIQFKNGKHWVLYSKYQDKGYAYIKETKRIVDDIIKVDQWLYWTQSGAKFIYDLMNHKPMQRTKFN